MAEKLVVRKTIAASPEEVFAHWVDADSMTRWMCPGDVTHARTRLDVRVGGRFEIVMAGPRGEVVHTGTYRLIDPPRKLVFTWISVNTDEKETLVTVELFARSPGTEVVLTHEDLPDRTFEAHRNGWGSILGRLAAAV